MEQDSTDPTGVRETSNSVQKATIVARERKAAMAANLYVEKHKTLAQVAEKCGYPDARAALVAIEHHMDREFREHPTSVARMRDMAGRRLDNLLRAVSKKALDPKHPEHLMAVQQYRGVITDWSKLYGLQAPQQVIVSNPTNDMIMEIALRIQQENAPQLNEGDIFDEDAPDDEVLALEARRNGTDIVEGELVTEPEPSRA